MQAFQFPFLSIAAATVNIHFPLAKANILKPDFRGFAVCDFNSCLIVFMYLL
jgi:hypothetical protein